MNRGRKTRSAAETVVTGQPARRRYWSRGFGMLAALLVSLWLGAPGRAAESMHTILFFGDSLTAGYGLDNPTADAYPALIQQKLAAQHPSWQAVNAGLSGETSAAGLHRIDWVLRQPVDILFLALGANDGLRGVDPAVTEHNLNAIIERVRAKYPAVKVVVAGMEMPPAMGDTFTRRFHEIFPRVAKEQHATLLPFLIAGVAGRPDLNQADSIHPTAAGHRIVAETVWKTLLPLL